MIVWQALHDFFVQQGREQTSTRTADKTYWIAFSGGLDSHVLLSLCSRLRDDFPYQFRAIHINHGLNPAAAAWAKHCSQICADYRIEYSERALHLALKPGDSLEEVAREQRYAIFAEYIKEGDMLLTAHQQDDQAETVLLQLLRGAGPKGLGAMPAIRSFAHGWHARPLLAFPRTILQQYAKDQQLKWIDDESNDNTQHTRNFIRHDILPVLKKRWPSVAATIARSATYCAEAQGLLEDYAVTELSHLLGSRKNTLSVRKLLQLDSAPQRLLLRTWIQQLGCPTPDAKRLMTIQEDVLHAAWDRMPRVHWADVELRRYRDDLYLLACLPPHSHAISPWDCMQPLTLAGIGTLQASLVRGYGLRHDCKNVSIQFRQGGEKACTPGVTGKVVSGRGRRTLKNLLQEWQIPPWERDRIPLIFVGEKWVAAVGYFIDPHYVAQGDEMGWEIKITEITPKGQGDA